MQSPRCRRLRGIGLIAACLAVLGCHRVNGTEDLHEGHPARTAREAVAQRVGGDAAIRIVSVEEVEFTDASLGCPQPGMAYAQVITPGYRVLVDAAGQQFDVRVAGRRGRICDRPGRDGVSPGGNE